MEQVKEEGDELRHEKANLDVEELDMTEDLNKKALEVLERVV